MSLVRDGKVELRNVVLGRDLGRTIEILSGVYQGRTTTYGELDERSSRFAAALEAEGVRAQERVALFDKNAPEYFDAVFGTAKLNAVLCPVNWRLSPFYAGVAALLLLVSLAMVGRPTDFIYFNF